MCLLLMFKIIYKTEQIHEIMRSKIQELVLETLIYVSCITKKHLSPELHVQLNTMQHKTACN